MENKNYAILILLFVVVGGVFYFVGNSVGYKKAMADTAKVREEVARKAAEDAAKASNPFATTEPTDDIGENPFADAKEALNPFQ